MFVYGCRKQNGINEGVYSASGVTFRERVTANRQAQILNTLPTVTIKGNTIIVTADSIIPYSYVDGKISIKVNNKEYSWECEDFSTTNRREYEVLVNGHEIKSIRFSSKE